MDDAPPLRPLLTTMTDSDQTSEIQPNSSMDGCQSTSTPIGNSSSSRIKKKKKNKNKMMVMVKKKKRKVLLFARNYNSDAASSSTSSFCGYKDGDVDTLALPLGMSIAAIVAQVIERKDSTGEDLAIDHLSKICSLAVRESLANVFGNTFDTFARNFEKSFRSTLTTLRLINGSSQYSGEQAIHSYDQISYGNATPQIIMGKEPCIANRSEEHRGCFEDRQPDHRSAQTDLVNVEREIFDGATNSLLACVSRCTTLSADSGSMLSTFEKSIIEQNRANDLKAYKIGLTMRKLQLKEKELALSSDLNLLERWKLVMGISKASFKEDKFKHQVKETRHAEMLRKCIDCLVAGLLIMLASIAYGTYVYSHSRIMEATASCMPSVEYKSWWLPKPMASINSGMQILWCQVQVVSRLLFGLALLSIILYLLVRRSTISTQNMPITFILLLVFVCGISGKFCIDTLGGSGYHWLFYWELLCILHLVSNLLTPAVFHVLHGPVTVCQGANDKTRFPYWMRRVLFYTTVLVLLPLLCGLLPFASTSEWKDHFKLQMIDFLQVVRY